MDGIDVMSVEVEDKGQLCCLLWTGGGTMVNRHESGIMLCRSSNKSLGDPCLISIAPFFLGGCNWSSSITSLS